VVSGGFAALLAGLLGFLISEKFGFELVDSGDFYYAYMYALFAGWSLRPFFWYYREMNDKDEAFLAPLLAPLVSPRLV
jgi:hypothetical protein